MIQPKTKTYSYEPALKKLTAHGYDSFPSELFEHAETIEFLDMSRGHLTLLPPEFATLKNLKVALFSHNDFTEIPSVLAECRQLEVLAFQSCKLSMIAEDALPVSLRGLTLTDNRIAALPKSIGKLAQLQKCTLAGNKLKALPEELLNCTNLELLRLSANNLVLPSWLFELPKLAWYTDTGNPNSFTLTAEFKSIPWSEVSIGEKISENSKNAVYKGHYAGQAVAVKIYGGALSTDGLPIDEINASTLAGTHDNIIGAIGRLGAGHDQKQGLVMPLIPADFTVLGQPPSFTSLTRDVFSEEQSFSQTVIITTLKAVAQALEYLHAQGIMHGDVYAHNILTDGSHSYLGDFGTASLYDRAHDPHKQRERIDVRGFGYLIDDLLGRRATSETTNLSLEQLRDACLASAITERPTFSDIRRTLDA